MLPSVKLLALKALAITCLVLGLIILTFPIGSKVAFALSSKGAPSKAGRENIVQVTSPSGEMSGGTGFLLATEDYGKLIVTNKHVCETAGPENVKHIIRQGNKRWTALTRVKSDITDLCIINAPQDFLQSASGLRLADRDAKAGDEVHVEGHPYLRPLIKYSGAFLNTVSEPLDIEEVNPAKWMRIGRLDFMVFPGNSGSPVLNEDGNVIGVVFAIEGLTRNALYIPLLELKYFLMQAGATP